jgi:hypothetical protein
MDIIFIPLPFTLNSERLKPSAPRIVIVSVM